MRKVSRMIDPSFSALEKVDLFLFYTGTNKPFEPSRKDGLE